MSPSLIVLACVVGLWSIVGLVVVGMRSARDASEREGSPIAAWAVSFVRVLVLWMI